jgi:hypothetical protein
VPNEHTEEPVSLPDEELVLGAALELDLLGATTATLWTPRWGCSPSPKLGYIRRPPAGWRISA